MVFSSPQYASGQMRPARWYDVSPKLADALSLLSLLPKPERSQLARWLIHELTATTSASAWMLTMTPDMLSSTAGAQVTFLARQEHTSTSRFNQYRSALSAQSCQRSSDVCPEMMLLVDILKRLPRHLHGLATNKLLWAIKHFSSPDKASLSSRLT
ncbi:MAG: hypothetical protein VKK59_02975 [Vampirovibrionales bacterium]|nr:hypothetical protein [Vampirovibrionales bacterium]